MLRDRINFSDVPQAGDLTVQSPSESWPDLSRIYPQRCSLFPHWPSFVAQLPGFECHVIGQRRELLTKIISFVLRLSYLLHLLPRQQLNKSLTLEKLSAEDSRDNHNNQNDYEYDDEYSGVYACAKDISNSFTTRKYNG